MGTRGSSSSTRRLPFGFFCKHGHQFGICSIHSGLPNWWDRLWRRCNRVCGLLAADGHWSGSLTGNEVKLRHLSSSTLIGRLFDAPETVYHGALGSTIISSALLSLTTLMQVVPQVESITCGVVSKGHSRHQKKSWLENLPWPMLSRVPVSFRRTRREDV